MNVIEQLKYHEDNQLDEWLDLDEKTTRKFMKKIVKFSSENLADIKIYCNNTLPSEFSSLSIIYEALSEYSTDYHEFLFEEIKRVINLAKSKKINPKYLEVLTDIESEDIYSKDEEVYIEILNFITSNLSVEHDKAFTIQLLEIVEWFLIDLDEDDDIKESKNWIEQITKLANHSEASVKIKARNTLQEIGVETSLAPLTFIEKIKGFFN